MTPLYARTRTAALSVLMAGMLGGLAYSASSAQRPGAELYQPVIEKAEGTAAQHLYPDAPDGVDPVTTGPVSQEFRERQRAARCDEAVWPEIPIACYP